MPTDETMNGGGDMPPMLTDEARDPGGMEVPVPLDALAMPGEDQKMNNPDIGDPVQMQAEGTVTRIEGQMAYVRVKTVNGKPVDAASAKTAQTPGDADGDNEFAQLRSEAAMQPQF